ncbi:MAG: FAD-binding domain-containing protein [Gemmataceae bacterium]
MKPATLPTGGRTAALAQLAAYDASRYGPSRNFLDAPVSRLSPYLRHGMLSLPEVRDHIRSRYAGQPELVEEYLRQLAWRDFFEKVLDWHGVALRDDLETAKHAVRRDALMPTDIATGRTGLPCIDGMLAELFETGYLHNHERLWFAAYFCHFRGLRWTHGARLFRQYLLDGDEASNSASWQWVESTFASKPYFMNQENIAHYSNNRWCADCQVRCPFRHSYERLQTELFGGNVAPLALKVLPPETVPPVPQSPLLHELPNFPPAGELIWVHDAMLSAADITVQTFPTAAVLYVQDDASRFDEPWAPHRTQFVQEGVADLFASIPQAVKHSATGDTVATIVAMARAIGAKAIATTDHPAPAVRGVIEQLQRQQTVRVLPRPVLADYTEEPRRFTRYWEKVSRQVLGYTAKPGRKMR